MADIKKKSIFESINNELGIYENDFAKVISDKNQYARKEKELIARLPEIYARLNEVESIVYNLKTTSLTESKALEAIMDKI